MKKRVGSILGFFNNYKRIFLYLLTFIIIYGTLITAVATKRYDLNVGDIASTDIKATRDGVDRVATETKKNEAIDKVKKSYSLKAEVQKDAENNVTEFFEGLENLVVPSYTPPTNNQGGTEETKPTENGEELGMSYDEKLAELTKIDVFGLTSEQEKYLLTLSPEYIVSLKDFIIKDIIKGAYEVPIPEDNKEALTNAQNDAYEKINNKYNDMDNDILTTISSQVIKPNWVLDNEKTQELIEEALKNVVPITYKKNQTIVEEGKPVSAAQLAILDELSLLNNSKFNMYVYLALAIMVVLVMYLQYGYIKRYYKKIYDDFSKLVMISLINVVTVVFGRVFGIVSPYLIPLACTPMLLTLLLNYKISLVLSMMNIILITGAVGFNPNVVVLALVSIVAGATSLRRMQQRNDILYSSITIAIITGIMALSISVLVTNNLTDILADTVYTVGGAFLSGVLTTGLLPFFESTFDIVTTVKLLELSNPNNPLLKKLLMEAPGTYHHSVLVANLAELATEEVGGNALLARIGAYYHDVGKTKRPYFFRENQIGRENPHDKITPSLSTMVIISHVNDGVELAKEYNVPKVIQDFIATHHGDTFVKYFYLTVKNNAENPDEVKKEDFMYPGPKPETKEQGILMLADSVEAAVRSINDPTEDKIAEMVNNIIKDKLSSGQLDNCDLTLRDIENIKKCFLKALNGIYHERIEYPTDNTKKEK